MNTKSIQKLKELYERNSLSDYVYQWIAVDENGVIANSRSATKVTKEAKKICKRKDFVLDFVNDKGLLTAPSGWIKDEKGNAKDISSKR